MGKTSNYCGLGVLFVGVLAALFVKVVLPHFDVLNGLSNEVALKPWAVQTVVTGFCLAGSKIVDGLLNADQFNETGVIDEDEYEKASIYAMLYGLYQSVGPVKHTNGELYEFTFNTWGIHNPENKPYGPDEPQRHGKAAYHKLVSDFPAIQEKMNNATDDSITFLEIGCGTGAGANLISGEVWNQKIKVYNALDMQAGAIKKCKAWPNAKLNCVHGNGKTLPFADNSIDVIVVSETHIAEKDIGDEEKAIFAEMTRVLKKGGLFMWGNALPTRVWRAGEKYLTSKEVGFTSCGSNDHTDSAVVARDEDHKRVELYLEQVYARFPVFNVPYYGPRCKTASDMLLRNFFRDVGTDLYLRMTTREDSYLHQCYSL
jgi:ubiquinone/menaquinone biosynthesis C-methylase UbiE